MDQITYFIPQYQKDYGEITKIMNENGKVEEIKTKCRCFLKRLCREHTIDPVASKSKYGKLIGGINLVPIPLSATTLLIPVKVRRPIAKSDGAMGYANFHQIKDSIDGKNTGVELIFLNGTRLKVLSKYKTLQKSIREAAIINEQYKKEMGIIKYADWNEPLTKAELTLLARLLLNVKNSLNM